MPAEPSFRLRSLPFAARLALTCLVLVNLGGYVASGLHVRGHHGNRDGRPELSYVDIAGAYHGVRSGAPLVTALRAGHPGELAGAEAPDEATRAALLDWLTGDPDQIVPNWDNLDLGEMAPAELLDVSCLPCHSRSAPEERRAEPPLEFVDDVRAVAFSRDVPRTDTAILLASTHAHAIALFTVTLIACALLYATRLPGTLKGTLSLLASGGLLADLAAWWLARESATFVVLIVAGGAAHAAGVGLAMLAVLVDVWWPTRHRRLNGVSR